MTKPLTLRGAAESLWETLAPGLPGFTVEVLAEIDSTNSELMRRARAGQLEPTLLVAERQTAGRGRLGRDWHSTGSATNPVGDVAQSLTFSLGLPFPAVDFSGLSLAVGLSVVQSLHPDLCLKWPNDVWLAGRKLAGILIETTTLGGQRYVVVGIGVNIQPRPETDLRTPAAALTELRPEWSAAMALHAVLPDLVRTLQTFVRQGFAPFQSAFAARDALRGQTVQTAGPPAETVVGVAQGVNSRGALLVHTAQGLREIGSSEVSVRPVGGAGPNPNP